MTDVGSDEGISAVVLDVLPRGRPEDERPQYKKEPVAYALGESDFRLLELTLDPEYKVTIGDEVVIEPSEEREAVTGVRAVDHDDLSGAARSELEYAVEQIIDANEREFVDFYNEAQPITLRLHQLNLLPGIGKKLRNNILEARKRQPFESFDDLEERVSGLHNPREKLEERILEELREEDLKYRNFARREGGGES